MTGHGQPVMENEPVSVRTPGEHLYKKRIVDYNYTDQQALPLIMVYDGLQEETAMLPKQTVIKLTT